MRVLILALVCATPAMADDLSFSTETVEACLDGDMGTECIGVSADACMDTPGGSTTVGMGFCFGQELTFWDDRLNAAYRALMTMERALDADAADATYPPPPRADALRDMQRSWIGYRDAACVYEYSQWGGGTGGGPAHAACMMHLTGEQALALEARLEDHQR